MSQDPVRDLLVVQRDRLAELSAAADELVRRYDALTDPPLPFDEHEIGKRFCATCDRPAEFYWHDATPFGAGTFYGCAAHAPARAEHMYGPGDTDDTVQPLHPRPVA